VAGELL